MLTSPNKQPTVSVVADQVYATLGAIAFSTRTEDYPGLSPWFKGLMASLPPERLETHNTLLRLFLSPIWPDTIETWLSFPAYLDWLAARSPEALITREMQRLLYTTGFAERHTPADLLANRDLLRRLAANAITEVGLADSALHIYLGYVDAPQTLLDESVEHLRWLWDEVFVAAWEEHKPAVVQTEQAFQRVHFAGMTVTQAVRAVTGREVNFMADAKFNDEFDELIFVPGLPIGPYVAFFSGQETIMRLVFAADTVHSTRRTQLSRAELLVRLNTLADDTRLRILELLVEHGELSSPAVMEHLSLSQSAASRHLRQLSLTGYLTERRHEGAKVYRLNRPRLDETLQALTDFFTIV
ncbi:MAG: winged helix-turn-helix transcriptional regulator [Chloroflexi bacterium]|nr:winged helix-turn-helix transcriptional regulator [Chloroflexota bacterium]